MKNPFTILFAIGLSSCAAPKAIVIEEAAVKPADAVAAVEPKPPVPSDPNDGMRIGEDDILALPSDEQLRSTPAPSGDGAAPVIVRPPKE